MIVCKERDRIKATRLINNLALDMPYAEFTYDESTGEIHENLFTGEELFHKYNIKLIWYANKISAWINGKEYYICAKNKLWESPGFDNYNEEITAAFWAAVNRGLIKELETFPTRVGSEMCKPENN